MSDKKHIDRVFQEKFKDFEVSPNPQVWNSIQNKLNQPQKDKKKVFPFWYKVAGVAALLLLMLTVGGLLLNNNFSINTNNTKVVDTENTLKDATNPSNETDINSTITNTSNEKNKVVNKVSTSESQISNNTNKDEDASDKSQIASEEGLQSKPFNNNNITNLSVKKNITDTRVTENTSSKSKMSTEEKTTEFDVKSSIEDGKNSTNLSTSNSKTDSRLTKNSPTESKKTSDKYSNKNSNNTNNSTKNNNIAVTQSNSKDGKTNLEFDNTKTENQLQQLSNTTTETGIAIEENTEAEVEETVEEALNKTDLTIEEAIAANQDLIEEEKDDIINRWQVYANVAPVYYNSMGKGSHIDDQFANNSKTGEVNTSYGVNVSYNLNKKLSIRTGLSSLNLSYDTNDVILYENIANSSTAPSPLRNINLSEGYKSLTAISADNLSVGQIDNSLSPKSNAAISQRISYFEVPVELSYRIGNKKLGLNLIAGFSSFILDGNEVYSELNDENTYIGEANNIKSMSFSTNFGVGLDYKFTEKFKFNLEPTFKYQLNAFENTSGNFNPYIIGVYTGFSYKF
ncbi:outer membrane beta-barrel protein [Xanthomarina sp. F2636L]|uniref:outer membrane beta-barrel protein n=1 Tax=Xanthomarina sp. F2636L TaxID=2996018 RepID=UPI00225E5CFB|nr:hypothetical protein [Xanthomarina sp. F2636L]MCX7551379.1 hypothetical protein [Xanthomarina sp. F2636L]